MAQSIRVIIIKEDELWVAQGLERDICVQAENLDDLQTFFEVAVRLEGEADGGLERIAPAPQYFHQLWDRRPGDYNPKTQGALAFEYGMAA